MLAGFPQVSEGATRPIDAVTGIIRIADEIERPSIFSSAFAVRLVQPSIETSSCHPQHSAHQRNGISVTMLVHEAVLHSGSPAKYRTAFLRNTHTVRYGLEVTAKRSGTALQIGKNPTAVLLIIRCGSRVLIAHAMP